MPKTFFHAGNLDQTEADVNWLRAATLAKRAAKGDQEAAAELARMESTPATGKRLYPPTEPHRYIYIIENEYDRETLEPMEVAVWVASEDEVDFEYLPGYDYRELDARRRVQSFSCTPRELFEHMAERPGGYLVWFSDIREVTIIGGLRDAVSQLFDEMTDRNPNYTKMKW